MHGDSRPHNRTQYEGMYQECSIPLQDEIDTKAMNNALADQQTTFKDGGTISWAPLYASLPVSP